MSTSDCMSRKQLGRNGTNSTSIFLFTQPLLDRISFFQTSRQLPARVLKYQPAAAAAKAAEVATTAQNTFEKYYSDGKDLLISCWQRDIHF